MSPSLEVLWGAFPILLFKLRFSKRMSKENNPYYIFLKILICVFSSRPAYGFNCLVGLALFECSLNVVRLVGL